ncbi:hypothetical protein [Microbacterium rhizomatis]|uniref:Type IV toxin-antitoxin system AbiEi family antitoxin domain-containing protein n=1 Tax=Microbacterium rhizomatis TaxID=1631477 RepID=A0A5J5IY03_9MICO|nr:hypothetical protein [Microbacterium rhizomatis]KAA9106315.1 hypothetical protein F6B43_14220 [Microbacterium rhizomatis]
MPRMITAHELRGALLDRGQLLARGWSDRGIRAAVESTRLHHVRRGAFIDGALWGELWAEGRHLARMIAVDRHAQGDPPVFAGLSAAVAHGLPLYRVEPAKVHVLVGAAERRSSSDVHRHEGALPEADVCVAQGLACTTPERTVYDVARLERPEVALPIADAALRQVALAGTEYSEARAADWLQGLHARIGRGVGARGIRRLRMIADLVDGRAQLPGESVSRLQLHRLGFARPRLQVAVVGPGGRRYYVDFALDDVDAFGEYDGKGKYLDPDLRSGLTTEEVLLAEKEREDWIRGTTGRALLRWGAEHIRSPELLGERLRRFGIVPPLAR